MSATTSRSSTRKSMADMVRSLALVLVVVVILLFIGPARALIFPGRDKIAPVDYSSVVNGFRTVTGTAVVVPASLPKSWRANAANLTRGKSAHAASMHIGWALPRSTFIELDETNGGAQPLLRTVLGPAGDAVRGSRSVAGVDWQVRRSQRGELALTGNVGGLFVVLTGNATDSDFATLASSLH